jgi:hypothetical protein
VGFAANGEGDHGTGDRLAVLVPGLTATTARFADADDAIAAFWAWWCANVLALTEALNCGQADDWRVQLSGRVRALHPKLQWELRRGQQALYALCLSGTGDAVLRITTERWRQARPDSDETWEFHAFRPAASNAGALVLHVAGEAMALADLRIGLLDDPSRERINCEVYHPAFAGMPTAMRDSVAVLLLDHAVGEEGVESWLGAISTATTVPEDPRTVTELSAAVVWRKETATGVNWGVTTAPSPEGTLFQIVNYAVKRWAYPTFDVRCDVTFELQRPTPAGIPDPWESEGFEAIEDGLARALTDHAVLVARTSGRQRHTVHLYAREDSVAPDAIAAWARGLDRPVTVHWEFDPEWRLLTSSPE